MDRKKRLLWTGIGIFVIVAVGVAVYVFLPKQANAPTNSPSSSQPSSHNGQNAQTSEPAPRESGKYVAYSEEAVRQASGIKILFFHAPWCPQCRALDKSIQESIIPDGVTIFKVDYDSNQALRQKYGVTLQTTLIEIDNAGNKVKSFVAYDDPSFDAVKRELLE